MRELLGLIERGIGQAPIARDHGFPSPIEAERQRTGGGELPLRLGIGLQENLSSAFEREKEIIGIDAVSAEHSLEPHRADRVKELDDRGCVHGVPRGAARSCQAVSASGLAGSIATDSPQPQADVWFGFSNTNCEANLSVR